MKIAINVLPLRSLHKDRGIGSYTSNLANLLKEEPSVTIKEFVDLSEVKDVDVVHFPWFDFYFHTLPNRIKFPTVVTIHDVIPLKFNENYPAGLRGKINFFLQKQSLKKSSAIITDSESSKKDIVRFLKIDPEKIKVIPLAADKDFKVLPESRLIYTKRKYNLTGRILLYVGDANWVKNLPFLIRVFNNLTKLPDLQNPKLVLVGSVFLKRVEDIDHPELQGLKELNKLIKDYKLENKIIRVGKIEKEDLVCFYNLADIYVQPSFYEGFGLPILEAMSCGVPVVSSNGGSLPEVGGKAVIYFDPINGRQLESIILEILSNKPLQDKLSKLGLKQAEKFNWAKVARQTLEVYSNVAKL